MNENNPDKLTNNVENSANNPEEKEQLAERIALSENNLNATFEATNNDKPLMHKELAKAAGVIMPRFFGIGNSTLDAPDAKYYNSTGRREAHNNRFTDTGTKVVDNMITIGAPALTAAVGGILATRFGLDPSTAATFAATGLTTALLGMPGMMALTQGMGKLNEKRVKAFQRDNN